MAFEGQLSLHVKKLGHPLKEIRERALQLLVAKLKLGWKLDDELETTRELLELLLAWFQIQKPTLQQEALFLFLNLIKTDAGNYVAKECGIKELINNLQSIKHKLDDNALEMFEDVVETLSFFRTFQSEENVGIPRLNLHSNSSSNSDKDSDNLGNINEESSNDSSVSIGYSDKQVIDNTQDGIEVLLFPWVDLSPSDAKTFRLVEDTLRLSKSTRRCCRFICDVFLRDFPPEIFLNKPSIIENLLTIINDAYSSRVCEALYVLLCLTKALRVRLTQYICSELVHISTNSTDKPRLSGDGDKYHMELTEMAGDGYHYAPEFAIKDDGLTLLKQLPAPIYALDTLHTLFSTMIRSVVLVDPVDKKDGLNMSELNMSVSLVENLVGLLLECVSESFWYVEHSSKTQRDIAHKSCMAMRMLADLLEKYRCSFIKDSGRVHHRTAWLRLLHCAERLLSWTRHSLLPPSSLAAALQTSQLDIALHTTYPTLAQRISTVLKSTKISTDQDFKKKYKQLIELTSSMEYAVQFMKNINSCCDSKDVLEIIKCSLPVLELHQSEAYLQDVCEILLTKLKDWNLNDTEWSLARSVTLSLMAHNCSWVQVFFYKMLSETVIKVFSSNDIQQTQNEKNLLLLCDVGILTEICCHGLNSQIEQVTINASDVVLYLLRGRLLLSDSCWWRLLASLLPILPLLHCFAEHDTELGQAVCKSLEVEIAECMGVPQAEIIIGLSRLLFVNCPAVQLDAALSLCQLLDDEKYLPPKEVLRSDVLMSALRRIKVQDFNVDNTSTSSQKSQTTGVLQVLEVLQQDIVITENGMGYPDSTTRSLPVLEPSLRRSTLQQLSVLMRQTDYHETFLKHDGLEIVVTLLRMSLLVDDCLAFPECALSCVSVLNSVCYNSRHALAKIADLPALLIRVILIFPSNDSLVLMASQVLCVTAWAGFTLQELDQERKRVLALPHCVTQHTRLPFPVQSYWTTSPNAAHSSIEWLLSDEPWHCALRVRWTCAWGGVEQTLRDPIPPPGPLSLRMVPGDLAALQAACPLRASSQALIKLQNATTHSKVNETIAILEGYTHLMGVSSVAVEEFSALPWSATMTRFLTAPPASPRDISLLICLLKFILQYVDNVPKDSSLTKWIIASFIESNDSMIKLLSRQELFPQQTDQESIEVSQLQKHIVKVLLRCVIILDREVAYDESKMESLFKILLACLERIDLKNFHMLGYLNEVIRCVRYIANSRYCRPSEDAMVQSMCQACRVLVGCAAGGGCKGQACSLDASLTLLALVRRAYQQNVPVQRWGECWSGEVMRAVCACGSAGRPELRAVALRLLAALAHYTQLLPHLQQAVPGGSLPKFAVTVFSEASEADATRAAAASLLSAMCSRVSPYTIIFENDILEQLKEHGFLESSLQLLADFGSEKERKRYIEPNVSPILIEQRAELEVRASKGVSELRAVAPTLAPSPPSLSLVSALAACLYNMCALARCPTVLWNEQGLFRLLFRCTWWSPEDASAVVTVASVAMCFGARRALARFALCNAAVRARLANTRDCLHAMLRTLQPLTTDELKIQMYEVHTQGLLLLGALVSDPSAADTVWTQIREDNADALFRLLLQCLQSEDPDFSETGMYCLTQLMQSIYHSKSKQKEGACLNEFLDNIPAPHAAVKKRHFRRSVRDRRAAGEASRDIDDCQPVYMAQSLCKALIYVYRKTAADTSGVELSKDNSWTRLCSCLGSLLCASERARAHAAHGGLPETLLASLQATRDHLAVHGKPADVIRNANNHPVLHTIYWILLVMECSMKDCAAAKECYAERNIANSLNNLWPWLMMTEELRETVVHLLKTFTNKCPKAWVSMCTCVGGRNLVTEMCAVAGREASLLSRPHPAHLLAAALHCLRHCAPHHHCRTVMLKSDVLSTVHRLRCTERGRTAAEGWAAWAGLAEAVSRHPEGSARLLELRPLSPPAAVRDALLPSIAHAAHHHRVTFLQSTELLELLSSALLSGDPVQVVPATRAVWALASNNHKAKLCLRNAGVSSAVTSALQRMQRGRCEPAELRARALHLLTYTNSVLHVG